MNDNKMKSPLSRFFMQMLFNQTSVSVIIFALFMIVSGFSPDDTVSVVFMWVICAVGVVFFLVSSYNLAVSVGRRDYNLVKYGHIRQDLLKGLKAAALSQIPGGAVLIAMLILAGTGAGGFVQTMFLILYYHLAALQNVYAIFGVGAALALFTGWIGYLNGFRQIDIWHKIMYKTPGKKDRDKRLR